MSPGPARAPDVGALIEPLLRHGVEFVVVGGMAGIAHGSSYPSYDLDIGYGRDSANLDRLVAALREIGVSLRNAPPDLPFQLDRRTLENGANFTFRTPHGDFDILGHIDGIRSFADLRAGAERKVVAGHEVPVASLDHLIAMKRASNRPKDQRMLEEYLVIADEQRAASDQSE